MQLLMAAFVAILFFVLTPGIVLSLPPKGSKIVVAATHAIVFAVVYSLTHKLVYSYLYEGFESPRCSEAKAELARDPTNSAKIQAKNAACAGPQPGRRRP
jgi:hypothetical protein